MAEISRLISQLNRCLQCRKPMCKAACPLSNDCPGIVLSVRNGKLADVANIVGHPFGGVCGSICPHELQCGGGCVLGKKGQPIQIGQAESTAFLSHPYKILRNGTHMAGKKVAVVGGGVAGVTFAVKCYEVGADVTIYESTRLLNTLYSIPNFRLPRKLLDDIVAEVAQMDIVVVNKKIDYAQLKKLCSANDIVYLAVGASIAYKAGFDGEELATTADDFLRSNVHGDVVVIGGGNTAMDCATKNIVDGGTTTVAYRRTVADMPAFIKEIDFAAEKGVRFATNLAPVSAAKTDDGKLSVVFAKTVSQGRGNFVVTEELQTFVCDVLVLATGSAFDKNVFPCDMFGDSQARYVSTDENGKVLRNLYAGGDCAGGKLVVDAVKHAVNTFKNLSFDEN